MGTLRGRGRPPHHHFWGLGYNNRLRDSHFLFQLLNFFHCVFHRVLHSMRKPTSWRESVGLLWAGSPQALPHFSKAPALSSVSYSGILGFLAMAVQKILILSFSRVCFTREKGPFDHTQDSWFPGFWEGDGSCAFRSSPGSYCCQERRASVCCGLMGSLEKWASFKEARLGLSPRSFST